jgi:hypothetical protein
MFPRSNTEHQDSRPEGCSDESQQLRSISWGGWRRRPGAARQPLLVGSVIEEAWKFVADASQANDLTIMTVH